MVGKLIRTWMLLVCLQICSGVVCPNSSFVNFGDFCLIMGSNSATNAAAMSICASINTSLPTFLNSTEVVTFSLLVPMLLTAGRPWLGYYNNLSHSVANTGIWFDQFHRSCPFITWASGEPNNQGDEFCTNMMMYNRTYGINDVGCGNALPAVCMWRPNPLPDCPTTTTSTTSTTSSSSTTTTGMTSSSTTTPALTTTTVTSSTTTPQPTSTTTVSITSTTNNPTMAATILLAAETPIVDVTYADTPQTVALSDSPPTDTYNNTTIAYGETSSEQKNTSQATATVKTDVIDIKSGQQAVNLLSILVTTVVLLTVAICICCFAAAASIYKRKKTLAPISIHTQT